MTEPQYLADRLQNHKVGIAFTLIALPPLVWFGNPAVALLVAAAVSVTLNQALVPDGSKLGGYALQAAIVLLGLKLNAGFVLTVSSDYTFVIAGYVVITLGTGLVMGRLLGMEPAPAKLVAAGTAICGGTTIASLSPIVGARPEQTAVAMALVFLLNAVALFTFPLVGHHLSLSETQFGLWAAMAIHDTSSVVATASLYGEEAAAVATTLKLGRTLWLIPCLLVFALLQKSSEAKLRVPAFVFLFVLASIVGTVVPLPAVVPELAGTTSSMLIVVALFGIGSAIGRETLRNLRGRMILQGLLLWALVVPATLGIVMWLPHGQ